MKETIHINFLDHVAIRAKDIEKSAKWYERVLGMKRTNTPRWNNYPLFMTTGKAGIAIFPANATDPMYEKDSKNVRIDHFAFNVDKENFMYAQEHYKQLGIKYDFSDHGYSKSIYTCDPDGHKVEITTLIVSEEEFYK